MIVFALGSRLSIWHNKAQLLRLRLSTCRVFTTNAGYVGQVGGFAAQSNQG
jgi:hypothetical protein